MLPSKYTCSSCNGSLSFSFLEAYYYLGPELTGQKIDSADLLAIPVRPAWCKTCTQLCLVEDIATLRDFENAYGAVRSGKRIEYPLETEHLEADFAMKEMEAYLRWRMSRLHAPRALCCGGNNFQFMDVAQPMFKHAECDFGYMQPVYSYPGSYNGPGPGVYGPANVRFYNAEGDLLGQLTWCKRGEHTWEHEKLSYPKVQEE